MTRADLRGVREVRLVVSGTNNIVPTEEAFRQAEDLALDLVIVSDKSTPPVVKIEDFRKLEYERKKQRKAQKAKAHNSQLKEVQFKMRIAEHDMEVKLDKVRAFLERGDKVKATVRLRGRERATPERARDLIGDIAKRVGCKITPGGPPHTAILEPLEKIDRDKLEKAKAAK